MKENTDELHTKLVELVKEHRELDLTITKLREQPHGDQFLITRLKKRKLLLKDMIARLNSLLIPDLNA